MSKCYVGIDVSKDISTAQGIDAQGKKLFYTEFAMNAEGFSKLLYTIRSHCEDLSKVKAAMEATGCYHSNLFCFLATEGMQCFVINPLLIANFAKLSLRKMKTDKKDAKTIAQFLLVHKDTLIKAAPTQDIQDLKDLAREKESLTVLISGLKNDIKRMLQITFPELESHCNVFSETMRDFLKQFPSARMIRTAKPYAIAKALTNADGRKTPSFCPEELIQSAQKSVATDSIAKELIIPEKIVTLEHLIKQRDRISTALVEACEATMVEDIEIITSIDGIGDATASAFLAEVGDYKMFPSYKHLIAFAGIDPSIHQSGKFEGTSKISKRGNRHLRRILYLMTSCVVRQDNVFRAYYLRRREDGLPFKKAILATAHKLVRVLFSMLMNRTTYKTEGVM
ncbi:MAG: IS110 family transposase [Thermodesulfovibrionales bacterium]|nr:IS110 family transposase [Thermodesulfovibrionales bacterium]